MVRPALSFSLALSMLAALAAGCADDAPQAPAAVAQTSSLRGVVVTQSIVPIADAIVRLTPGNLSTTTDAGGLFAFEPVEPGSYLLLVEADGYADLRIEAVAGGELIRAVMDNVRSDVP